MPPEDLTSMLVDADTNGDEDSDVQQLRVTFFPPLFLQRRMWILDVLRRENVVDVLDIGCGEGQLLAVLCVPAQWLPAPPQSLLYPDTESESESGLESTPPTSPASPSPLSPINIFNHPSDPIPNIHATRIAGLDISESDLKFAIEATAPPSSAGEESIDPWKRNWNTHIRWENLDAKIWKGGLERINEEFVGVECIVSTEVIEHLPPLTLPFFGPILLGVYHPRLLLITTPSYTFNARFTSPHSPPSVRLRTGYLDPTKRTSRIFRHSDHKFEWTPDEFRAYCEKGAREWGYRVECADVGRAQETDEWGRDEELGGATLVAKFVRIDDDDEGVDRKALEKRAREIVGKLSDELSEYEHPLSPLQSDTVNVRSSTTLDPDPERLLPTTTITAASAPSTSPHTLLASHTHPAHPSSSCPLPLPSIGSLIVRKMTDLRESFIRIDELWFDSDIAEACGGYIEMLVRAAETCPGLTLKRDSSNPTSPSVVSPLHESEAGMPCSSSAFASCSSGNADADAGSIGVGVGGVNSVHTSITNANAPTLNVPNMNIQRQRELWKVELAGGARRVGGTLPVMNQRMLWPTTEVSVADDDDERELSVEYMPAEWNPVEEYKSEYDYEGDGDGDYDYSDGGAEWEAEKDSREGVRGAGAGTGDGDGDGWEDEVSYTYSTGSGVEGDVSWGEDDLSTEEEGEVDTSTEVWGSESSVWGSGSGSESSTATHPMQGSGSAWGTAGTQSQLDVYGPDSEAKWSGTRTGLNLKTRNGRARAASLPVSSGSSMTGWDGDEDDSDDTTS